MKFIAFALAFGASLLLTPFIRKLALAQKIVDHPNHRKIHQAPIPLLGSIAVYLGFLIGMSFSGSNPFINKEIITLFFAGTLLLIVGILDDCGILHPQIKLMVAMPVAGLILIFFDLHLKILPINFLNYFFTIFWIVGITAAYNLLDGMDGLSSGVCVIASFFYFLTGLIANDSFLVSISLPLMGACLAFLIYNFHPAKIFLGDSGAIFLGFMLAAMGLRVANHETLPLLTRWMIPILILMVPIFDTSLITISRIRRGLIPFLHPGKDHSHHRLYNLGLGQRKTVLSIYLFGIASGLISLIIYRLPIAGAYLLFCLILLSCLALLFFFEKLPYERQELLKSEAKIDRP